MVSGAATEESGTEGSGADLGVGQEKMSKVRAAPDGELLEQGSGYPHSH